jgi:hypothetical protein
MNPEAFGPEVLKTMLDQWKMFFRGMLFNFFGSSLAFFFKGSGLARLRRIKIGKPEGFQMVTIFYLNKFTH